jgi:carbamoyltransferase
MVGKVARSGIFDSVFVQPASHDAGCALGAALQVHKDLSKEVAIEPLSDVYWGPNLDGAEPVHEQLAAWSEFVNVERVPDIAREAAGLIADGSILGWAQGRSEFGPRALGNRSILADPRPAANRDRINAVVKHRESYRPFAPAVTEEDADEYFEIPSGTCAEYMTLTVPVRKNMREVLAAITHIDGTARVQAVSRSKNPVFWSLLDAFRKRTGIPVLLNTSFNHSVEPIVQSIDDAVTCFLTTGLCHLVIDNYLVTKKEEIASRVFDLVPLIPPYIRVTHALQADARGYREDVFRCEHNVASSKTRTITPVTHAILSHLDGTRSVGELLESQQALDGTGAVAAEIWELWAARLIRLLPRAAARRQAGQSGLVSA